MISHIKPIIIRHVYKKSISTTCSALLLPRLTSNRTDYDSKRDLHRYSERRASSYHCYSLRATHCEQHLLLSKVPFITEDVCSPSKQPLADPCSEEIPTVIYDQKDSCPKRWVHIPRSGNHAARPFPSEGF